MIRYVFLCLSAISFSTGQAQQTDYCIQGRFSQIPYFEVADIVVQKDIIFGAAPRWPSPAMDTLKMDIYMPDPAGDYLPKRPMVLLIHGGSFINGQREDMAPLCMDLARRGFVAATMSYRLGWDCNPTFSLFSICADCGNQADKLRVAAYRSVQDARAGLRFLAAHATDYGIDTEALIIGGTSAGSVAAIHALYLDQQTANSFCPHCEAAVGPLDEGVNDFQGDYKIIGLINNCGAILDPAALDNAAEVPVIHFHDDNDCVVPSNQGWALGCFNCTAFFQGHGSQQIHAYAGTQETCSQLNLRISSLLHCTFPAATIVNRSACFFKKTFCGACETSINNNINAIDQCDALGSPVSIHNPASYTSWHLYPNPVSDVLFIETVNIEMTDAALQISVTDIAGRIIHSSFTGASDRLAINVESWMPGIYLVQITHQGLTKTHKIIRQ